MDNTVVNPYVQPIDSSLTNYNYGAGPFENGGFGPGDSYGGGDFYGGGGGGGTLYRGAIEEYAHGGIINLLRNYYHG